MSSAGQNVEESFFYSGDDMVTRSIKGEIIAPGIVVGELCVNGFTWDSPRDVVGVSNQELGADISRFESEA